MRHMVALPAGANAQFGQCSLEVFLGHPRLLNELEVLGWRENVGRIGAFAAAMQGVLVYFHLGLLEGVQHLAIEHDLAHAPGFDALFDASTPLVKAKA